mgnify:CR=1 FL=1
MSLLSELCCCDKSECEVIAVSYYDEDFKLAEVISFLKNRDYSSFDFRREYTANDALISIKDTDALFTICNVPDNMIPEQTVIQVIDVLEHLDECIEQASDWLTSHEFELGLQHLKNNWKPGEAWGKEVKSWCEYWKETKLDTVKKRYTVSEICFRLDDFWPTSVMEEYCRGPEPQKGADVFFIDFCHRDCDSGFRFMFLCEDRRLYKFIIHIL